MKFRRFGIIGAMDIETAQIKAKLSDIKTMTKAGNTFYEGTLGAHTVVVVTSGVGKVFAAITAQILIDCFDVDCIINSGIAGGLSSALNPLDIVISSDTVIHDFITDKPEITPIKANEALVARLKTLCDTSSFLKDSKHHIGRIATGDQFIMTTAQRDHINESCDNPLCVEMEGGAIAQCADANGVPFAILRTISDFADENAEDHYYKAKDQAAQIAGDLIINLIESF